MTMCAKPRGMSLREKMPENGFMKRRPKPGRCFSNNTLRTFADIESSDKILIAGRLDVVVFIFTQILDVSLGQRMHGFHCRYECAFALHHAVDHTVERNRRQCCKRGVFRDTVVAVDSDSCVIADYRSLVQECGYLECCARRPRWHGHAGRHFG